ncbi:MAG TPA: penicillin acylase family protein [Stellaceae bacterium]|jgi:penicillin amidase
MRWLWRIFVVVMVLIAAVLLWLRTTGPGSTIRFAGLTAPVTIERDRYNIPTITADNVKDALFAVGYLHAESRLFQMELTRRYGAGRLSELFGASALPTDKYMRVLGLERAAEAQLKALSPQALGELTAYVAGVNAWLTQRSVALPPEYYLIGARPEPWKATDTLLWGKLMSLQLSGNFRDELLRARILRHIKPDELAILFPPYPKGMPSATGETNAWLKGLDLDAMYAAIPPVVGPIYESNNWVVDGAHTASGKPMLANDPHLSLNAPGVWYLLHIRTPQLDVAGVTAPGNPYVVLGHNLHAAWGFTTTGSDVEDLFIEKVDPKDPARYLTPTGSQPFVTREETIGVKGAAPVKLTVRETRHGPVISDLGGKYGESAESGTVLALQVTWASADDRSPEALRGVNFATNWAQFRDAMKLFVGPEQNMVFADDSGEIGFIAPARIPIRAKGDGYMPVPGWSGDYDWKGYIPFDELPQGLNPKTGRFVTANAKIVPDSYKYFISRDWDIPNRTERINQMLDGMKDKKLVPDDFAKMQADTMSLMALDLVQLMTAIQPTDERDRRAVERLKAWNFRMDRDLVEPTMFVAWLRELNRALFAKKLGDVFPDYWAPKPLVVRGILIEHREWCVPDGGKAGDCAAVLAASLHSALDLLAARYGGDMSGWTWGRAHIAPFPNQFWANVPVLGRLFALGIPTDGGSDTVNRADMEYAHESDPFADLHGPGLRTVVDLSAPADARFLITPGQSANPLSAHYSDLMRRWRDFVWLKFSKMSPAATTRLLPAATANRGD